MAPAFRLRPYRTEDEDAAISLWQQTWQQAYPEIDFAARPSDEPDDLYGVAQLAHIACGGHAGDLSIPRTFAHVQS